MISFAEGDLAAGIVFHGNSGIEIFSVQDVNCKKFPHGILVMQETLHQIVLLSKVLVYNILFFDSFLLQIILSETENT